jgi:hypothetical protein
VQPLKFCNWYYQSSCCLPSHDADIQQKFLTLIEAGETCAKYNNEAKMFLSAAFCYGCDPKEPLHFTPPLNKEFFQAEKSVKICSELAEKIHPDFFMDCGMTLPDDRESVCSPNSAVSSLYI